MNIINNESLYTDYLVEINVQKVNMIILLIEESFSFLVVLVIKYEFLFIFEIFLY